MFGDQLAGSLELPVPDFLSPAGTSTVATPATGAWTVTNFTVNNARLDQQAGTLDLADAGGLLSSLPDQAYGLASQSDVVHMDLKPFGLELNGIRVQASQVSLNASVAHPPGLFESQWATVMSAVERVLGLFAAALDTAARAVGRAALAIHLPPALVNYFDRLYPPGTVHVFGWSYGPLSFREPGIGVSVPTLRVDLYADTGPGKTLGNILAAMTRIIVEGGGGLEDPGKLRPPIPRSPRGPGGLGPDLPPGAGGGGLVDPMSSPKPGESGGSGGKSDATPGGSPVVWIVVPVKLSAAGQKPFAAVVMQSGGTPSPSLLVERIEPVNRPEVVEQKDDHSLFEDDIPLVLVLPDIALPEEERRHVMPYEPEGGRADAEGQVSGGPARWGSEVVMQRLQATVAPVGEEVSQPPVPLAAPAGGNAVPVRERAPTGENAPVQLVDARNPESACEEPAGAVTSPFWVVLVGPKLLHDAVGSRRVVKSTAGPEKPLPAPLHSR